MCNCKTPPSTTPTTGRLVKQAEAAEYAHCSRWTIRRRIADGTIAGIRSGKRTILVDLDEVDAKLLRQIPTVGQ